MASTSCASQIVTSRRSIVGNAKASLRPIPCAPRQFAGMCADGSANRLGCSIGAFTAKRVNLSAQAGRRSSTVAVTAAAKGYKVALLGSAGGIGQPLGLLLKMNKYISELSLFDIAPVNKGVAADLSHCNTPVKVEGYVGDAELGQALAGAQLVVIPAGVPRKPGMTRDDLFNINAGIVKNLVEGIAKHAPNAVIAIISNPVNSTVPIAAEVLKAAGVYDPKKVLGVTTLDVVRANTFVAEAKNLDLKGVDVPVIGGHAGTTILPLLSQTTPSASFTDAEVDALTKHIQEAGTEVVEAKQGAGSATLSMAYAAARFAESVLLGFEGNSDIYEAAYVATDMIPGLTHFATKVKLGKEGVEQIPPLPQLSAYEQKALEEAKSILAGNIKKGVEFASAVPASA